MIKTSFSILISISGLLFFQNTALASNKLISPADNYQQQTFLKAEKLLHKSRGKRYQNLYAQLNDYPLQPYLDQKRLIATMRLSSEQEIAQFLTKYRSTPLDWPLRKAWLIYLAKKNKASIFLKYFKPSSNVKLSCNHLSYSLKTGLPASVVLPQVTKLWLVGKSQPKACDSLFDAWEKAGYRTNEHILKRIQLAADGGKHTLIPYLTKLLPIEQQYLGRLWHKVRRDPAYIVSMKRFPTKSLAESEIFTYGVKRLIWRSPDRALASYLAAIKVFSFTEYQQKSITAKFALALAKKNHQSAQHWLRQVPAQNKDMLQWRLVEVLKQQNWPVIAKELAIMPDSFKSSLQWQYWHAKALIQNGHQVAGKKLMNDIATKRHYYGFLAASYLAIPSSLQNVPLDFTLSEKMKLLENPAAQRAFAWFNLKRYREGRSEWNYWLSTLSNSNKLIAAKIANEKKWFDRAIFTLSKVGYLDDVQLRFPQAYADNITQQAAKQKINPAWAFAITRRESSFMSDAHSAVGAKGLMQLMPLTAKSLTRKRITTKYLLNAENNIALGTEYLRKLLDKNKGNLVLATASYNAGPYRVKTWLKKSKALPADIWIETIPYKETRNYVKSVLAYQEIYQHQADKVSAIFAKVIKMTI